MEEKKEQPIDTIKQTYKIGYQFFSKHGVTTVVLTLFLFSSLITGYWQYYLGIYIPYLIYFISAMLYKKRNYEVAEYRFYQDRLEYRRKKNQQQDMVILYENVKQVGYKEIPFQKVFKMGDILLVIKNKRFPNNRLYIWDVENAKEQYKKIEKIIKEHN